MFEFPVSGVETYWWLPGLVAFLISSFTSTGGVTGAFVILPFQVSVLKYTAPGASSTNLLYNIVAIPVGVIRLARENRMEWHLAWATGIGTIPGLVLGAYIRLQYLPDPRPFKLFAGFVLLLLAAKLIFEIARRTRPKGTGRKPASYEVTHIEFSLRRIAWQFDNETHSLPTIPVLLISFVVGAVGGIYGLGGGAILSPFLVAVFALPVHSIAGAMLVGTWITSVAGVVVYLVLSPMITGTYVTGMPDWLLGLSFGVGGLCGVYLGSRMARFVPAGLIRVILAIGLLIIAARYIGGFFTS